MISELLFSSRNDEFKHLKSLTRRSQLKMSADIDLEYETVAPR